MLRFIRFLVVLSMVLSFVPVTRTTAVPVANPPLQSPSSPRSAPRPTSVRAETASASPIADDLNNFVGILNQLGSLDQLGMPLPLTDLGPASEKALRLANVFSDSLRSQLNALSSTALSDLQTAIISATGTYPNPNGVHIVFSNVSVVTDVVNSNLVNISFTVTATRGIAAPIAFDKDALALHGGSLSATLDLSSTFQFQYDTSQANPSLALYLVNTPTIMLSTKATGAIGAFTSQLGFTEINVTGTANLNLDLAAQFVDPDSNGRITLDEWTNTALIDLVHTHFVTSTSSVSATLGIDSSLVPGSPDGSLTLNAPHFDGSPLTPTISITALDDFTNVQPADVLSGLSQFASGLISSQNAGDVQLPFLQQSLGSALVFAQPLIDFLHKQGDAAIVCGTEPTDPPTGASTNLAIDQDVYCQAIALQNTQAVTWTISNGTITSGAHLTETVDTNPTVNAHFVMTATGSPQVHVTYVDLLTQTHTVEPRFLTAQELFQKLGELGGFNMNPNNLHYDPDTSSLTYHLILNSRDPNPITGTLDFGNRLQAATSLIGLSSTGTAGVEIDPGSVNLDVTFGVLLVKHITDTVPGGTLADRFFIKARSGPDEYEFSANATITATVDLAGHVGFLEVRAKGDASANPTDPTAFKIGPIDSNKPMLGVNIVPGGDINVGGHLITDAIRLPQLITSSIASHIDPDINIRMSGGLSVTAELGDPAILLAGGKVSINWPDITAGAPTISADGHYTDSLQAFDLNPFSVQGTHNGITSTEILTDTAASPNFASVSGLVGSSVRNLTDGSTCVATALAGPTGLVCHLSGGADNRWDPGDRYEAGGNPLMMLSLILDNLDRIASLLGSSSLMNKPLPFIGSNFKDLVQQFKVLDQKLDLIRTGGGQGAGLIACHTAGGGSAATVLPDTLIYCRATLPEDVVVTNVDWNITGGAEAANTTFTTTVGMTPTVDAVFTVTAKTGTYQLHLTYADTISHTADYPAVEVPTSLQELQSTLTDALGLPKNALQIEIGDPDHNNVKDLIFRLGYGICTPDYNPNPGGDNPCTRAMTLTKKLEKSLDFNLGSTGSLVGLETGGQIGLDFSAIAQLNFGVELDPANFSVAHPLSSTFLLNTTGLAATAGITTQALALTASVGPLSIGVVSGTMALGAKFGLGYPTPSGEQKIDLTSGLGVTLTGTHVDCGSGVAGDACARLPLQFNNTPLGDVTFAIPDGGLFNPGTWPTPTIPPTLTTYLSSQAFSFELFFTGLNYLLDRLQETLDGNTHAKRIPLVGTDLSGGSSLIQKFQDGVVEPVHQVVSGLGGLSTGAITTCVSSILYDALGPAAVLKPTAPDNIPLLSSEALAALPYHIFLPGITAQATKSSLNGATADCGGLPVPAAQHFDILRDTQPPLNGTAGPEDVKVIAICTGGAVCASGAPASQINDIRVEFSIGKTEHVASAFDIGIPGLRLQSTDPVTGSVYWQFTPSFGISRTQGFYLASVNGPELSVGADAQMPASMQAELAFLAVTVTDKLPPTSHSGISLTLGLDTGNAISVPLSLSTLSHGFDYSRFGFNIGASALISLSLNTHLRGDEKAGFPSAGADFLLDWPDPIHATDQITIAFNDVTINSGSFLNQFLGPIVKEVKKVISPLMPVIDTVRAPLPVLSDLSKLVGGPPISLWSLIEAIADPDDLALVTKILDLLQFINDLNINGGNTAVRMGSFVINGPKALQGPVTPDQADTLIGSSNPTSDALEQMAGAFDTAVYRSQGGRGLKPARFTSDAGNGLREHKGGLSFPFLEQPSQVFGLLLGKDITLIRFDPGKIRATAGVNYTFGPIMVGPIPISIILAGSATLEGRFAMGYDSSGLRKVLTQGSSGEHLFDGIFIDDLDERGVDVPEIKLIGQVSAGAAIDLLIVSAGVEGGIRLTVNLNLNDSPNPDGKLRIDEIWNKLKNPICLFDVSGKLEAFLAAFVKVGVWIFSHTFRFEIANVTLLDFSVSPCAPPKPELARIEDADGDGVNDLVLNLGIHADRRNIQKEEDSEDFVVRQLNAQGTQFSVSAFGVYQEFPPDLNSGPQLSSSSKVWASGDNSHGDADKIGEDNLSFEAGVQITPSLPISFTATVVVTGGLGNDQIKTGLGNDFIWGSGGNDKISAGDGADHVYGGNGDDVISGDLGDDYLYGEADNDVLTGGPGADYLYGGGGDDSLIGGPGTNQPDGSDGLNPDKGDHLYGEAGNDTLEGDFGADHLYGDEDLGAYPAACNADGATGEPNADSLTGGPGDDFLYGGAGTDALSGEEGHDTLCGNSGDDVLDGDAESAVTDGGNDHLWGGKGHDVLFGRGGNDDLHGGDNDDDLTGGNGRDLLYGDDGNDILLGDTGIIGTHETVLHTHVYTDVLSILTITNQPSVGTIDCSSVGTAGGNADCLYGGDGGDFMFGEGGDDQMSGNDGNDYMEGNAGIDTMAGNAGTDTMRGGQDADVMHGNENADTMYGDSGTDTMYGDDGNDFMRGGIDADYMEGNADQDTMYGDGGADRMMGGSSSSANDTKDFMYGGAGEDLMAGDNAIMTSLTNFELRDVPYAGAVPNTAFYGNDEMYGEDGNDRMYGQSGEDQLWGGAGDDYIEGNAHHDVINGDEGEDDIVGGSGYDMPGGVRHELSDVIDENDELYGGDGVDFMAGDNARITRNSPRQIVLYDVPFLNVTVDASVSGDDEMFGDAAPDVMYGQSGNDIMHGNDGDDYMEGNAGADVMYGDAGEDDLIGGSGHDNGAGGFRRLENVVDENVNGLDGEIHGDEMHGGDSHDVMTGDNALITWPGGSHTYTNSVTITTRAVELYNVQTVTTTANVRLSGDDSMFGDMGTDMMFGQGAIDTMHGGADADYMEGNHAADIMYGDGGEDDMIGGGSANDGIIDADRVGDSLRDEGDQMWGDDGDNDPATNDDDGDVMAGDNAKIVRVLDAEGHWQIDPNTDDVVRQVFLYDVQHADGPPISPLTSGSDVMWGEGGHDLMYGQGNGVEVDDDGDGRFDEDPLQDVGLDGIDNDRDGRESGASATFDCLDGVDNDNDGLIDTADPDCAAKIDEDGGGDEMHGGAGDDFMEGNAGGDWMFGDADDDDMLGGSSSGDGAIGSGMPPTNLADGDDTMMGGAGDDVMAGDNATIVRPTDTNGLWIRLVGFGFNLVVRQTTMAHTPELSGAFGNDWMQGNGDHDDMYGQLGNDYMEGNFGQDAMVGDLGNITDNLLGDGISDTMPLDLMIRPNPPFLTDTIYLSGSLYRQVELFAFLPDQGGEGNDVMLGGDGDDSMHGGPGNDIMNGDGDSIVVDWGPPIVSIDPLTETVDEDHLFGGDGNDVMWGGRGHDHLWGGYGDDYLDVKPRSADVYAPPDPAVWFVYGRVDNYQDIDYIYGGWDRDAMQANVADMGPVPGDRLIDWVGAYNVYYLCPALYGDWVITRDLSPDMVGFLQKLALGDGALTTNVNGTSGFRETAIVFQQEARFNSHSPHPDNPGHFFCY